MAHPAMKEDVTNTEMNPVERPEHEQIAQLAYILWQARGCPEGSPDEDWLRAEQDLTTLR
jgi:hypothetical protein